VDLNLDLNKCISNRSCDSISLRTIAILYLFYGTSLRYTFPEVRLFTHWTLSIPLHSSASSVLFDFRSFRFQFLKRFSLITGIIIHVSLVTIYLQFTVNNLAVDHRGLDFGPENFGLRYLHDVAVEDDEVSLFPDFERADLVFGEGGIGGVEGHAFESLGAGEFLFGIPSPGAMGRVSCD